MNLLRQKVNFLIKLFFKKPSERSGRLWTDGHVILYECTALTAELQALSINIVFTSKMNQVQDSNFF